MRLIANNDGTWSAHDETYDIIIRCGTKEENERVMELLKNEPISKKDVLEIIKETGGCDSSDNFSKGWDEWLAMRSRRRYRKGYSMDRKETTKFLGELLERQYLSGLGKHWAKEVNIDPGSARTHRRIDYMLFQPAGQRNISDIEKGNLLSVTKSRVARQMYIAGMG